jgi:protein-tyrosine phosphatase
VIDILVLCTGNVCRSPMAELLLRDQLAQRGVDARVSSAGILPGGQPASEEVVELLDQRGIDATEHRSRQVTAEMVGDADLVLGMARMHVREAVVMQPERFNRMFTLKELVRLGRASGPRREGSVDDWLDRLGLGRNPAGLVGDDELDDVQDPMGLRFSVFRKVDLELVELTGALTDLVWPTAGAPSGRAPGPTPEQASESARGGGRFWNRRGRLAAG